jgi:hypothetical protein
VESTRTCATTAEHAHRCLRQWEHRGNEEPRGVSRLLNLRAESSDAASAVTAPSSALIQFLFPHVGAATQPIAFA